MFFDVSSNKNISVLSKISLAESLGFVDRLIDLRMGHPPPALCPTSVFVSADASIIN